MKKMLPILSALFISTVSAYGESYGKIIGGIYIDTELVAASIIFIAFFAGILIATRKMHLFKNDVVRIITSIAISAFAILGLNKIGLDYTKIIVGIGLETFFLKNLTLIILALFIIFSIWKGIANTIMILGGIIFSAGILGTFNPDLVYNWELTLLIGIIVFIIGLLLKRKFKLPRRNPLRSTNSKRRQISKLQKDFKKASNKGDHEKANHILKQIKMLEE